MYTPWTRAKLVRKKYILYILINYIVLHRKKKRDRKIIIIITGKYIVAVTGDEWRDRDTIGCCFLVSTTVLLRL